MAGRAWTTVWCGTQEQWVDVNMGYLGAIQTESFHPQSIPFLLPICCTTATCPRHAFVRVRSSRLIAPLAAELCNGTKHPVAFQWGNGRTHMHKLGYERKELAVLNEWITITCGVCVDGSYPMGNLECQAENDSWRNSEFAVHAPFHRGLHIWSSSVVKASFYFRKG